MKNKKLTYFLLPAVISLWGYLIYIVFGAVNAVNESTSPIVKVPKKEEDLAYYRIKDYDSLALNYRDPLYVQHGTTPTKTEEAQIDASTNAAPPSYNIPPITVPETVIIYAGFIENEEKKKRVAIVKIENKQYMLATGESQDGVTIKDVQHSHIRIVHKDKTKIIYK